MKPNKLASALCSLSLVCSLIQGAWAQTPPAIAQAPVQLNVPAPHAAPAAGLLSVTPEASSQNTLKTPTHREVLALNQLTASSDLRLLGIQNRQDLEFTLRKDQLATQAWLELAFTPSPALLSKLSHLLVYLNDELTGVVPVRDSEPGVQQKNTLALDTAFLSTYNRIRLEFIGHYTDVCEDLAHSSLWLDLSRQTRVIIDQETLPLANDLAFFPEPFVDLNDMQPQTVPMVFSQSPDHTMLEAASTLASYFGSKARWRKVDYQVHINNLPDHNAIVFATNDQRPPFLMDYPKVEKPAVFMMSTPENPYRKLLVIMGRDSQDLKTAVQALSLGSPTLRGASVTIDNVTTLKPRQPYDAPNWLPTNRPVSFAELVEYPGQLEVQGLRPRPIRLNFNLPPDLFVWRSNGIPLDLIYRYTSPIKRDESRLTLGLNNLFITSFPLLPQNDQSTMARLQLSVLGNDPIADRSSLTIPALRVGGQNQIGLDFSFASVVGSAEPGTCRTQLPTDTRAAVDGQSTLDFTGYTHYIEMPNLRAFANSGFPFSRLADLSETVVIMPENSSTDHLTTLLSTMSLIGSQTGYPAYALSITHDWHTASQRDADLLWIGNTPEGFRERPDANLLLNHTQTILTQPVRSVHNEQTSHRTSYDPEPGVDRSVQVGMTSAAPIGAIIGMQSPYHAKRSMVGLLGSSPEDLSLIRDALTDPGKRNFIQGSVSIMRTSGVSGELVGPTYFVGELRWWELAWFHLSNKPVLLVFLAVLMALIISILLWKGLKFIAYRRLNQDQ